jgi:calcium-independent phospholipase A2-gamma
MLNASETAFLSLNVTAAPTQRQHRGRARAAASPRSRRASRGWRSRARFGSRVFLFAARRKLVCVARQRQSESISPEQPSGSSFAEQENGPIRRPDDTDQCRSDGEEPAVRERYGFRAAGQGALSFSNGLYQVARHAVRVCVPLALSVWDQLSTLLHEVSRKPPNLSEEKRHTELEIENLEMSRRKSMREAQMLSSHSGYDMSTSSSPQGPPNAPHTKPAQEPSAMTSSALLAKRRRFLRAFGCIPEVVLYDLLTECEMRERIMKTESPTAKSSHPTQRSAYVPYEVQRVIFDELMTPAIDAPETKTYLGEDLPGVQPRDVQRTPGRDTETGDASITGTEVAVPVPAHVMDSLAAAMTSWEDNAEGMATRTDSQTNLAGVLGQTRTELPIPKVSAPESKATTDPNIAQDKADAGTGRSTSGGNILYIPISALGSLWHSISALSAGGRKRREEAHRIRTYTNAADAMAREDASFAGLAGTDGGSSMASAFATASAIMASAPTSATANRNRGEKRHDFSTGTKRDDAAEPGLSASFELKKPFATAQKAQSGSVNSENASDDLRSKQSKMTPAASPGNQESRETVEPKTKAAATAAPPAVATEPSAQSVKTSEKTGGWWSALSPFGWFRSRGATGPDQNESEETGDYGIESIQRLLLSRHYGASTGSVHADAVAFDELVERVQQLTLRAAAEAAMAIRTRKQATAFIEEVGLSPLLNALSLSTGHHSRTVATNEKDTAPNESRAGRQRSMTTTLRETEFTVSLAVGALANLANIMPPAKPEMLRYPSLVSDLLRLLEAPVAGEAWEMQAKWSASMLIGTLTMDAPLHERAMFFRNRRLVRVLESMAEGTRVGYPEDVARASRRALACLGVHHWRPRVRGQRGLRILALDGGGTRALMSFEILKHITKLTGCPLHEMFDIICGTSTGAIIAGSLGIRRRPVEEVESLYRELIGKIFAKKLSSAPKMLLTRAYYDTDLFESILKREAGSLRLIDSSMDREMNYVFFVSSVMNRRPHQLHLFRNYCYAPGQESRYPGTVDATLWQGMRASSAAPTFFSEIVLNGLIHADGALVANNPAGVAAHEARRLFPNVPIELLVSVGTGVAEKSRSPASMNWADGGPLSETGIGDGLTAENDAASALSEAAASAAVSSDGNGNAAAAPSRMSWNDVINSIVDSAVGTESVHHILEDVLPPSVYFRYNPEISVMNIDEVRPGKLKEMIRCAQDYIEANSARFEELAARLRPKMPQNLLERIRFEMQEEASLIFDLDDTRDGPVPAL